MSAQIIVLAVFIIILFVAHHQMQKSIDHLSDKLRGKMDKPPEPSEWDRWKEERAKKPLLTKEELDKVMTKEEKELRKELFEKS